MIVCGDKIILKCIWKYKGARRSNTILKIKSKLGGINNIKIYCIYITASVIKTV